MIPEGAAVTLVYRYMRIFIDESGDPHPSAGSRCFAVGALVVIDDRPLASMLDEVAGEHEALPHVFHATNDSIGLRDALWSALHSSDLVFHFRAVAFDIPEMPAEHSVESARRMHQRALGLVLSFLPFTPPGTRVVISERAQSFTQADTDRLWQSITDASWESLTSLPELRRTSFSDPPMSVVEGTPSRGLQLCDHILWRWQRAIRNPHEPIPWPVRTLALWQRPSPELRHFQMINFMRGGSPLFDGLSEYSRSRPSLQAPKSNILWDTYGTLAYEGETSLSEMDHALVRLLLYSSDEEVFSEEGVTRLCYMMIEGRTRWRHHFEVAEQKFGHVSALASMHIAESQLDQEARIRSLDAMRYAIQDFRHQNAAIRARSNGG